MNYAVNEPRIEHGLNTDDQYNLESRTVNNPEGNGCFRGFFLHASSWSSSSVFDPCFIRG